MNDTATQTEFNRLCDIEPELRTILDDITALLKNQTAFCANSVWYAQDGFRARMSELVGWHARNPELQNSAAYDVAYEVLYARLPDCRNCGCLTAE